MEKDSFKKILKDIRPMTKEERQRAIEKSERNNGVSTDKNTDGQGVLREQQRDQDA